MVLAIVTKSPRTSSLVWIEAWLVWVDGDVNCPIKIEVIGNEISDFETL